MCPIGGQALVDLGGGFVVGLGVGLGVALGVGPAVGAAKGVDAGDGVTCGTTDSRPPGDRLVDGPGVGKPASVDEGLPLAPPTAAANADGAWLPDETTGDDRVTRPTSATAAISTAAPPIRSRRVRVELPAGTGGVVAT